MAERLIDFYDEYLLGRAGEHLAVLMWRRCEGGWEVSAGGPVRTGRTLADALMPLLDDLGVSYEPRPSAERVAEVERAIRGPIGALGAESRARTIQKVRNEFAREPLTVLALLSGGETPGGV